LENMKGRHHFSYKRSRLQKLCGKLETGFIWFRTGTSGGVL